MENMIKSIKIKDKIIGNGYPTFLIAEMACAHQGNVQAACDLVKVAVKAKVDAIQLQIFKKEFYMSPINEDYDLMTRLELSQEEWSEVIDLIKKEDVLLFVAGYDVETIKFVIEKDVDAFKIHSSDTSNPEVLKEVALSKKPVFLSCGASKIDEIHKAIEFLKKNGTENIILMHGYQGFPTKLEDNHLKFIKTLKRNFGLNVGYYDHVDGGSILAKIIPIMAISYGANVIEKHFILTREDKGIDYESSLEPEDFIQFSDLLRKCELAIGNSNVRNFTERELKYREYCKKSIVAKKAVPKGTSITRDNVMFVRSAPGIPPDHFEEIRGRITKREIPQFNNIRYEDLK